MDPANPGDLQRLREAIRHSQKELEPFRQQYRERLVQYAGDGYGDNRDAVDSPFNVYNLALRIYKRRLFSGQMRVLVTSRSPSERRAAWELGLAGDDVVREIKLDATFDKVLQQALLSVGIVKIGLVAEGTAESQSYLQDADQPYVEPVLLEDFAFDTAAKAWDQVDFAANRYRVPLADVVDNPLFDAAATKGLAASETRNAEELRSDGADDDSIQRLGMGSNALREEIRDYVTLWDVWLPKEGLLVTMADQSGGPALRVVPWEGPEHGPFLMLGFDVVPGNVLPVAPGAHLMGLARLLNRMMRKLGDQADRQKNVTLVSRAASQNRTGQAVVDAEDGEAIPTDDPKAFTQLRMGGIDQNSYAFFTGVMNLFSYLGGNIDTIGGLSSRADTLGQEKLLAEAGNGLISDMDACVLQFLKQVLTDVCWYVYSDPTARRELVARVEGTDYQLSVPWGPERRTIPWFLFQFDVDPFSVHVRSPSERLQSVMQMYQTIVMPMMQYMAQTGLAFDLEAFWRLLVRYTGLHELSDLLKAGGLPITGEPKEAMGEMPSKAPFTSREYVRRNVGSGANTGMSQGPGQQALQMMMAGEE
jgi:hypothetical protein